MERVVSTLRVHKLAEHDPEEKQSQKPTQEYEPGTFQGAVAMMKKVRAQMAGSIASTFDCQSGQNRLSGKNAVVHPDGLRLGALQL